MRCVEGEGGGKREKMEGKEVEGSEEEGEGGVRGIEAGKVACVCDEFRALM